MPRLARWPRTSIAGWLTSRSAPWREPWTRSCHAGWTRHRTRSDWRPRRRRWPGLSASRPCSQCRPRPTSGSRGPTSTWRSPTRTARANAELKTANEGEKQRFNLAMDAIKLFHGEVSEDLLLKEKQFEDLRTKLLKGAADFYSRLEDLLKGQTDRESRAALGKAYDELGGLDGQDRRPARGTGGPSQGAGGASGAGVRAGGGRRNEARRGAEPDRRRGVAAFYRRHARGAGGRTRRHCVLRRRAKRRERGRPGSGGAGYGLPSTSEACCSRRATRPGAGGVRQGAGHPSEAGRRQPRRHSVPARPGDEPQQPRHPAGRDGRHARGAGGVRQGAGHPSEAGRRQPRRHAVPAIPGIKPQQHRHPAVRDGRPGRGAGGVWPALAIQQKLADANPSVTQFQQVLASATTTSAPCCPRRATRPGRGRRTARRWPSARSWPTPTPASPSSSKTWR